MNKQFATVAVMAALCLTLVGCGGSDGPNLRPELEKLTEQVEKQTEQVEKQTEQVEKQTEQLEQVQDDLFTERKEAADTQKELQEQIDEAKKEIDEAKEETAAAERQAAEERQKAEAATAEAGRKAQEQLRQQAQASEANQRARGILGALSDTSNVVMDLPAGLSATVAKPKTLKIAASADYKTAGSPTSFTGFRSARLRSPSTLGDGFQRTLVAYTDRETSRDILVHLKANVAKDDNKIQLGLGNNGFEASLFDMLSASLKRQLKEDDPDTADDNEGMLTRNSFSSSLYGVTGNLICLNSGASCGITITTRVVDVPDTPASEAMGIVTAADGILYFQPTGNRQIPLDGTVKFDTMGIPDDDTNAAALTDTEFMVFGWWEERPDDTGVAYNIDVFADGEGLVNGLGFSGTARYVGRAAGFYAETDLAADPVKIGAQTHPFVEAGEFTASVSLNVTFGSGGEVDGTVGNFVKNNGSRPAWSVSICAPFCDDPNDRSNTDDTAILTLPGVTAMGTSAVRFVPDLANDLVIKGPAVGAVGTFDVSLDNVLELTGAFGAHKQ